MKRTIILALLVLSVLVATTAQLPSVEAAVCGDGIIQAPNDYSFYEQCDEGTANGDACDAEPGQTCSYCSSSCTIKTIEGPEPTYCGDGKVQKPNDNGLYEQCDEGVDNTNLAQAPYGETVSYCSSSCQQETVNGGYCGDGICQPGYENAFTCNQDCNGGGTTPSLSVDLWANPTYVTAPATVTYSCSAAFGKTPYAYTLTFGDGSSRSSATGPYGTHVYDEPGSYTMRCSVRDASGTTKTDSELITVIELDIAPIASFTANPKQIYVDESISYSCQGQSGNGALSYETFFGDGATTSRTSGTHSYTATGTYTAGCTVTDEDGDFDTDTETIRVIERPDLKPVVDLSASPTSGDAPLYVNYSCSVSGGDAPVTSVVRFGDGASSSTLAGFHRYDEPGVYTLSCSATDADGDADSESVTITVTEPYVDLAPIVDLDVTPTSGDAPLRIDYSCSVTSGNAPVSSSVMIGGVRMSGLSGSYVFEDAGSYDVVCEATDVDGDYDSDSVIVTVDEPYVDLTPSVDLSVAPTTGYAPLTVDYTCEVSGGNAPLTSRVSVDGSSTSALDGEITFTNTGSYTIVCSATDADGDSDRDSVTVTVKEPIKPLDVELIATPESGDAPLDVDYACLAKGGVGPYSYTMRFGDSSQASGANGEHTYDDAGTYTMTCTAQDSRGEQASDSATIIVREPYVDLAPIVDLDVTPTSGDAPLRIDYSCSVTSGNAPISSSVSIDGVRMSGLSGSYVFEEAGSYDVVCEATDVDGDYDSDSVTVTVTEPYVDLMPSVKLSASPTWDYAPMDVRYSCDVSGGNAPVSTVVTFGDGSSSSDLDSSYLYDEPGYYTMTCTATDADGDTASDSVSIRVKEPVDLMPVVDLDVTPTSGDAPLRIDYSCSVSGGDAPVSSSVSIDGVPVNALSGSYVFDDPGSYDIVCSATDVDGDSDSDSATVVVSEPDVEPVVELSASPTWGFAPMDVRYSCDVSGGNAPVSTVVTFGDGSSSSDLDSSHTYTEPGYYTMTCTATDADGDTASDSVSIRVKEPVDLMPVVDLHVTPTSGDAPLRIDYSCSVSGGDAPVSSSVSIDGVRMSSLSGSYVFEEAGSYDVVCEATDVDGDYDSDSVTVTVTEPYVDLTPIVELTASPTSGDAPLDVVYSCAVSGGNAPVSTTITFGDGASSSDLDSTHRYDAPGTYTMTCTATDVDGDSDSDSVTIVVEEPYVDLTPSVELDVTPTYGEAPLTVDYLCDVSGGNAPIVSRVSVDGSSTSALSGEITFEVPGTYDVVCSATDVDGDSDSDSVTVTVVEPDTVPVVHLSASPLEGYAPLEVDYACSVSGGNAPVTTMISFSDGGSSSVLEGSRTYTTPGSYSIACEATDADSDSDADSVTITVLDSGDGPTSIEFSATPDYGVEPLVSNIVCEAFGGVAPYTYEVFFGDTRTATYAGEVDDDVTYYRFGVYDLTCTATDAFGRSIDASEQVTVLPDSPVDITPDDPRDSDTLTCEVVEYDETFTYVWTRNGVVIAETDDESATLAASLTSVGDVIECIAYLPGTDAEIGRDTETIGEDPYTGPTSISFDVSPNAGVSPLDVSWTCDVDGGIAPIDYEIVIEHDGMTQMSNLASATAILTDTANYTFTCTATDANGDSLSAQDFVEVMGVDYTGRWSISADPLSGEVPLTVVFDADTSDIPIVGEVRWDFADGLEGLGAPIAHTFTKVGTYLVTAYATLDDGRVLEKQVTIVVTPSGDGGTSIDMDRVRISHTFAEVVGNRVYGTVSVRNDAGVSIRPSRASLYLPEYNIYDSVEMPRIPDGSMRTVSFFIDLDEPGFDTYAVFVVQNEQIRLQDATIVLG